MYIEPQECSVCKDREDHLLLIEDLQTEEVFCNLRTLIWHRRWFGSLYCSLLDQTLHKLLAGLCTLPKAIDEVTDIYVLAWEAAQVLPLNGHQILADRYPGSLV